tara:strand:- start:172 stop:1395 length:1224 start_codon:yes stop_codon:yes gene_type:complete
MNLVKMNEQVIIAGAGPVGLTAALALCLKNIPVTIVDSYKNVPTDPRASTFHPPTMELLESIGVTEQMKKGGTIVDKWQYRDRKKGLIAEFNLGILSDITKYPYRLHFEQHKYAQLLLSKVEKFEHATVIKNATVINTEQNEDFAKIIFKNEYEEKQILGKFLIGADGGKSVVRNNLDVEFKGLTFPERFLVLTTPFNFKPYGFSGTCYIADPNEWCSMFNVPANGPPGRWRIVFPEKSNRPEKKLFDDQECQNRLQNFFPNPKGDMYNIIHKNIYQVHQRIASKFRVGRIFLAGDAAHINNPLGGMGLNFGIHDALNLSDKIYKFIHKQDNEQIFDLYDRQRRTVAKEYLLAQTAQNKRDLEENEPSEREKRHKEWQEIANNHEKSKSFLLRTAMFESTERARNIN